MAEGCTANRHLPEPEQVREAILDYQRVHLAWETESEPSRREELRRQLGYCHQRLWDLLEPIFLKVTRQQSRRWLEQQVGGSAVEDVTTVQQSVAYDLYLGCVEWLRRVTLDPAKNVLAFVEQKARYLLLDARGMARSRKGRGKEVPSLKMWPPYTLTPVTTSTDVMEKADPVTSEMEQHVVDEFHRQVIGQAARQFWSTLPKKSQRIMELRYSNPPLTWDEIAQQLGDTAGNVRRQHSRVLKKTIEYLQSIGLLDGFDGRT